METHVFASNGRYARFDHAAKKVSSVRLWTSLTSHKSLAREETGSTLGVQDVHARHVLLRTSMKRATQTGRARDRDLRRSPMPQLRVHAAR